MNRTAFKNIAVFIFAAIILCIILFFVNQRDNRVVDLWNRNKYTVDSIYVSVSERAMTAQFADSILPALQKKGLIVKIEQNELSTTITVSGNIWKERSQFFKENFLTHLSVYNKVHGYPPSAVVIDQLNGQIYAQIFQPDRKEIYE